eukprot:scaffold4613_cov77-Phaeocystis_antarctica.AAC.3
MTVSNASATFRCTDASADASAASAWRVNAAAGRIRRTCSESGVVLWSVSGARLPADSVGACTEPPASSSARNECSSFASRRSLATPHWVAPTSPLECLRTESYRRYPRRPRSKPPRCQPGRGRLRRPTASPPLSRPPSAHLACGGHPRSSPASQPHPTRSSWRLCDRRSSAPPWQTQCRRETRSADRREGCWPACSTDTRTAHKQAWGQVVWAVAHLKSRCQVQPLSSVGVCKYNSASTACTRTRSFCRHVSGLGAAVKCSMRRRYSQSDGCRPPSAGRRGTRPTRRGSSPTVAASEGGCTSSGSQPLCGDRTAPACSDRPASPPHAAAAGTPQAKQAPRQGTPVQSHRFQSGGPRQIRQSPAAAHPAQTPGLPRHCLPTGPPPRPAPLPTRHRAQIEGPSTAPPTELVRLRAPCPRPTAPQHVPRPPRFLRVARPPLPRSPAAAIAPPSPLRATAAAAGSSACASPSAGRATSEPPSARPRLRARGAPRGQSTGPRDHRPPWRPAAPRRRLRLSRQPQRRWRAA